MASSIREGFSRVRQSLQETRESIATFCSHRCQYVPEQRQEATYIPDQPGQRSEEGKATARPIVTSSSRVLPCDDAICDSFAEVIARIEPKLSECRIFQISRFEDIEQGDDEVKLFLVEPATAEQHALHRTGFWIGYTVYKKRFLLPNTEQTFIIQRIAENAHGVLVSALPQAKALQSRQFDDINFAEDTTLIALPSPDGQPFTLTIQGSTYLFDNAPGNRHFHPKELPSSMDIPQLRGLCLSRGASALDLVCRTSIHPQLRDLTPEDCEDERAFAKKSVRLLKTAQLMDDSGIRPSYAWVWDKSLFVEGHDEGSHFVLPKHPEDVRDSHLFGQQPENNKTVLATLLLLLHTQRHCEEQFFNELRETFNFFENLSRRSFIETDDVLRCRINDSSLVEEYEDEETSEKTKSLIMPKMRNTITKEFIKYYTEQLRELCKIHYYLPNAIKSKNWDQTLSTIYECMNIVQLPQLVSLNKMAISQLHKLLDMDDTEFLDIYRKEYSPILYDILKFRKIRFEHEAYQGDKSSIIKLKILVCTHVESFKETKPIIKKISGDPASQMDQAYALTVNSFEKLMKPHDEISRLLYDIIHEGKSLAYFNTGVETLVSATD